MSRSERIQHLFLIVTFILLVVTGMPLILKKIGLIGGDFSLERLFHIRGLIHRGAAVWFILTIVWYHGYAIFTRRGRANFKALIPRWSDARDAVSQIGYNLGLSRTLHKKGIFSGFFDRHPFWLFREAPAYDRYNFIEKFEYWSVVWGSFVMILSGFFMWKEELSLSLFPLWVHDIFIVVHGYEAILAFLAVILWHMYNVHLSSEVFPMSRIWLDGKITGRELRILHPVEYRRILAERMNAGRTDGPDITQ